MYQKPRISVCRASVRASAVPTGRYGATWYLVDGEEGAGGAPIADGMRRARTGIGRRADTGVAAPTPVAALTPSPLLSFRYQSPLL